MNNVVKIIFVVGVFLIADSLIYSQPVTWMRYYSYNNRADVAYSTWQTYDGGYIIAGPSNIGGNHQNILLIKVNYLGILEWKKLLGDTSLIVFEYARKIEQLKDSSFLIVGEGNNKMLLLNTDKNGNILWRKEYTQQNGDARGWSFQLTNEGGIILCGDIFFPSPVATYSYIVKTDRNGNLEWQKVYTDLLDVTADDIIQSNDNNYYFCANSFIRKIDGQGNALWTHSYQNGFGYVTFRGMLLESENVIYAGGGSDSSGISAMHLIKVDSSGKMSWYGRYLPLTGEANATSICFSKNRDIAMTGNYLNNNEGDVIFARVSTSGSLINYNILSTPGDIEDGAKCIMPANDNGFIIVGSTAYAGTESYPNVLAIKTDSIGNAPMLLNINEQLSENKKFIIYQNYPNPFNSSTIINYELKKYAHIKLSVYNIVGKQIASLVNSYQNSGNYSIKFNAQNLSSGIYLYILELYELNINESNLKSQEIKKMMLIK